MKFTRQRQWFGAAVAALLLTLSPGTSRIPFLSLQEAIAAPLPTATDVAVTQPPIRIADNLKTIGRGPAAYRPNKTFTLRTDIGEGKLIFAGEGGTIDGKANPDLQVNLGDVVQINLIDGDGAEHDITLPDFKAQSDLVRHKGASSVIAFRADKEGSFIYFCSIPGHKEAGMIGRITVVNPKNAKAVNNTQAADIIQLPTDLPRPIGKRGPQLVRVNLETVEVEGQLADGTTYTYWTFNRKVPGPFIRVRVGDTVELSLQNDAKSRMIHSVDLHAVTGQGGGAALTQTSPGDEKTFTFKPLNPGLFVYHCATPMVAHHITSGMYGLILVEPEGGLPAVDREFYVMQGELYTVDAQGKQGRQEFSVDKLLNEQPEYFVFNGAAKALADKQPLHAKVGETVRIFFGVGGPNFTSSFHVIGEVFDRVYPEAALTSNPETNVQTTTVPPGGATMVEFKLEVPGRYIMVDHALSRLERGLVGFLEVEGEEHPEIYHSGPASDSNRVAVHPNHLQPSAS